MVGSEPARRRTSRQLRAVLAAVERCGDHPTAAAVYLEVRRVLPRISLGTVYRDLNRLAEEGKVAVADVGQRPVRYDATVRPHDHFVCQKCGYIEDVESPQRRPRSAAVERAGHCISSRKLVLYGVCRACRRGRRPRSGRRRAWRTRRPQLEEERRWHTR